MAHRDCIKKYLLQNQTYSCETCKANYAVGRYPIKIFNHITPSDITSWLGRSFLIFVFIIMMILIILFISSFSNDTDLVQAWKIALIVLFGVVIGLMGIYVIFVIRSILKRLRRSDIEVYCNQTEIGLHTKNPKEILKDYYENAIHLSLLDDYNVNDVNDEKEEIVKRQATNASILHTKEEERNKKYEKELQNFDQILNIYDEEGGEARMKKKNYDYERNVEVPIVIHDYKNDMRKNNALKMSENMPNDIIEEMSSIKIEKKDITNNESFHSVNKIIEENVQQKSIKKPNISAQGKPKNFSQTEEDKEDRGNKRQARTDTYGHHGMTTELQKTVNQYEDIDLGFNIQIEQPKINKDASLSLSLTNHEPIK